MNCAWCSPSNNGTDGICDSCILLCFNVDPATIHAEIAAEETQTAATWDDGQLSPILERSLVTGTKPTRQKRMSHTRQTKVALRPYDHSFA
jgi:hypothetical protein